MTQSSLFSGDELDILKFGHVMESDMDRFMAETLYHYGGYFAMMFDSYRPLCTSLFEWYEKDREQPKLLDISRRTSRKRWFRTRSGRWQVAYLTFSSSQSPE